MKVAASAFLAVSLASSLSAQTGTVTIYRAGDSQIGTTESVMVDGAKLADFENDNQLTSALPPGRHAIEWDAARALPLVIEVAPVGTQYVRVHMDYPRFKKHICCIASGRGDGRSGIAANAPTAREQHQGGAPGRT